MGVVASGAGDDALARNRVLDGSQELDLLRVAEARGLTGRAGDDDAVRPVVDEHDGELFGRGVIDRSVGLERREHGGQQTSDFFRHLPTTPISTACSAICTAFSAAPLRRLSDTIHSTRPCRVEASSRMRPTKTSSLPATPLGVGYSFACGSSSTTTPGDVASSSRTSSALIFSAGSTNTDSPWPPRTGTRTQVAVMRSSGS